MDSAADHFNQLAQSCGVRTSGTTSVSEIQIVTVNIIIKSIILWSYYFGLEFGILTAWDVEWEIALQDYWVEYCARGTGLSII